MHAFGFCKGTKGKKSLIVYWFSKRTKVFWENKKLKGPKIMDRGSNIIILFYLFYMLL